MALEPLDCSEQEGAVLPSPLISGGPCCQRVYKFQGGLSLSKNYKTYEVILREEYTTLNKNLSTVESNP